MKRSIKSYFVNGLLRLMVKRRLPSADAVNDLNAKFSKLDAMLASIPDDAAIDDIDMDGVPGRRVSCPRSRPERVLFYIHGGGWVLDLLNSHLDFVARLCARLECTAYVPQYRLAPAHPFPAPQDDCLRAYRWLLDQGVDPARTVLAGESAGGCMSLSLLQRARAASLPLPCCASIYSPAADLTVSGASVVANDKRDPMFTLQAILVMRNAHARETDLVNPLVSPLFGAFDGLPPLQILCGSTEILLSDSERVAERARQAGVDTELAVWDKMPHAFPLLSSLPEARQAQADIAEFAARHGGWQAEGGSGASASP